MSCKNPPPETPPLLQYSQHTPPEDLRSWIRLIWTLATDASESGGGEPVIPDGCAELIINLGDPFAQRAKGDAAFREQPMTLVNGQLHSAVSLRALGTVHLVGIRLQPWALGALMGAPAHNFTDQWFALDDITSRLLPGLRDHLLNIRADETVLDIVAHHLRLLIAKRRSPDVKLRAVVKRIGSAAPTGSLKNICLDAGISERTLQRLFVDQVGLSAKQYAKILRVQCALRFRQANGSSTWSRAALDAGYYDQSHFVKDFRTVVGCAPTELIVEPESLTEAFMSD